VRQTVGGRYKNWDSFRHGMERGKNVITVYLDEITDQLMAVADEHDFSYGAPPETPDSSMDRLLKPDGSIPDWIGQVAEHRIASLRTRMVDERRTINAIPVSDESGDEYYPHWNPLN
jgi:hypothetical protein